jgi:hypothetical protein
MLSSSDRPATAPAPAARVRGCPPEDRERLESVKRGEIVLLQPRAKYGKWSLSDLYALGQQIKDGYLKLADLKRVPDQYAVPYSTMTDWLKPVDEAGTPKWLYERDVRRRTEKLRPGGVKGGGTICRS